MLGLAVTAQRQGARTGMAAENRRRERYEQLGRIELGVDAFRKEFSFIQRTIMQHRQMQGSASVQPVKEILIKSLDCPVAGTCGYAGFDLAIIMIHENQGFDFQQVANELSRAANSTAAVKIIQRVQGDQIHQLFAYLFGGI